MSEPFFLGITEGYDSSSENYTIYGGIFSRWGGYAPSSVMTAASVLVELFKQMGDPKNPLIKDKRALVKATITSCTDDGEPVLERREIAQVNVGMGNYDIAIDITDLKRIQIFECPFESSVCEEGSDESSPDEVFAKLPRDVDINDNPLSPYEFAILYEKAYPHFQGEELDLSALKKYGHWKQDSFDEDDEDETEDEDDENEKENDEDGGEEGEDDEDDGEYNEDGEDNEDDEPKNQKKKKVETIDIDSVTIPRGVRNTSVSFRTASGGETFKAVLGRYRVEIGISAAEVDGIDIHLSQTELFIFRYFCLHPNSLISEDEMIRVLSTSAEGSGNKDKIKLYLSAIRRKLAHFDDIDIEMTPAGYTLKCVGGTAQTSGASLKTKPRHKEEAALNQASDLNKEPHEPTRISEESIQKKPAVDQDVSGSDSIEKIIIPSSPKKVEVSLNADSASSDTADSGLESDPSLGISGHEVGLKQSEDDIAAFVGNTIKVVDDYLQKAFAVLTIDVRQKYYGDDFRKFSRLVYVNIEMFLIDLSHRRLGGVKEKQAIFLDQFTKATRVDILSLDSPQLTTYSSIWNNRILMDAIYKTNDSLLISESVFGRFYHDFLVGVNTIQTEGFDYNKIFLHDFFLQCVVEYLALQIGLDKTREIINKLTPEFNAFSYRIVSLDANGKPKPVPA